MAITEITDYLFVASKITKKNIDEVTDLDPMLVISMIAHRRPPKELDQLPTNVLWLRTFDFFLLPIPIKTIVRGVEAAIPVIRAGDRVVVFCEAGRHRSVAMASCILIGMGYQADEAMSLIKEKRPIADPYAWHIQRRIRKFEAYWQEIESNRLSSNDG